MGSQVPVLPTPMVTAQPRIRDLDLSRDAMLSSIDSLRTLMANEQAITRVTKRRLAQTKNELDVQLKKGNNGPPSHARNTVVQLNKAIGDIQQRDSELSRKNVYLQNNMAELAALRKKLAEIDKECQREDPSEALTSIRSQLETCVMKYNIATKELNDDKDFKRMAERDLDLLKEEFSARLGKDFRSDSCLNLTLHSSQKVEAVDEQQGATQQRMTGTQQMGKKAIPKRKSRSRSQAKGGKAVGNPGKDAGRGPSRSKEMNPPLEISKTRNAEKTANDTNTADSFPSQDAETKVLLKRKLMELKIARAVIAEKDKTVKNAREEATREKASAQQAAAKLASQNEFITRLEQQLALMKSNVESRNEINCHRRHWTELDESRLTNLESEIQQTRQEASASCRVARESENKRIEFEALQQSMERRCHQAISEKQAVIQELEQSKAALSAKEQEIVRLENFLKQNASYAAEYAGSSSPCSQVTDADSNMSSSPSNYEALQSLAELEEAASAASSKTRKNDGARPEQMKSIAEQSAALEGLSKALRVSRSSCERQKEQLQETAAVVKQQGETIRRLKNDLASASSKLQKSHEVTSEQVNAGTEQSAEMDSLATALDVSRMSCEKQKQELEESAALVNRHEGTIRRLRAELTSRVEESEALRAELTSRVEESEALQQTIQTELRSALQDANELSEARGQSLQKIQEELELSKSSAENAEAGLKAKVKSVGERLQSSLAVLESTQSRVLQLENRGELLENQLAEVRTEKHELHQHLETSQQSSEHHRRALVLVQERLLEIETVSGVHRQTAVDAEQEAKSLVQKLSNESDKRIAAESRASRKDALVFELEERAKELERHFAMLKGHLAKKTESAQAAEEEMRLLRRALDIKEKAMHDQGEIACRQEALFESLGTELRSVIRTKDEEKVAIKEELSSLERQMKSLSGKMEQEKEKRNSTERELTVAQRMIRDSESENRRNSVKLSDIEDEFSHLKAKYITLQEDLAARDSEISSHLSTLSERDNYIAGLRAQKMKLESNICDLQYSLQQKTSSYESLVANAHALEKNISLSESNLTACKASLATERFQTDALRKSLTDTRKEVMELKSVIVEKENKIRSKEEAVSDLKHSLKRCKQQVVALEGHIDGHDTLLKDYQEKEESLSQTTAELNQARTSIAQMNRENESLRESMSSLQRETQSIQERITSLEAEKAESENDARRISDEKHAVAESLQATEGQLQALEESRSEEMTDLNGKLASLKKELDEKTALLSSASATILQNSERSKNAKEQLLDARTRGDRLYSKLTATEYDLASRKEAINALEKKLCRLQDALRQQEDDRQRLEKTVLEQDQALSLERVKSDQAERRTGSIAKGELLTVQTKLEAKEKAIANLHNWCCFINGKLHSAEKALSDKQMDLEVSVTAFKKLKAELLSQNALLSAKEQELRKLDFTRTEEVSLLQKQIQSLDAYSEETKSELSRIRGMLSYEEGDGRAALLTVSSELSMCKAKLKEKESEASQALLDKNSAYDKMKRCERNLAASERMVESLSLELEKVRSDFSSRQDVRDVTETKSADEVSQIRSDAGYLMIQLRRAEAELSAAAENVETWRLKAEELQPLAENTVQAQRAVEILTSQLSLVEREGKQRVDLLETQLREAERERDTAEHDCSAAIADYAAMRVRLANVHHARIAQGHVSTTSALCSVTFLLEGKDAPGAGIMVYILGGDAALGQWDASRGLPVPVIGEGRNGVVRKCEVKLPRNASTAYKYAADGPSGTLVWEGDDNRSLDTRGAVSLSLNDEWRSP